MKIFLRVVLRAFFILSTSPAIYGSSNANYTWPSPQFDAIEKFLYEGTNVFGSALSALTDNCQKRLGPPSSTVAAEWLRLAYHDMATHNTTDGTGGLDASIFFELDRPENVGAGNSNSVADFRNAATKYVSRSDIIAMAAVWAVASCGGPQVAYRYGRQDAMLAGRSGVPLAQEDLASHTESFRLQGFTPTEMISLVACGHTLGGVRAVDFPNIVIDPTNATIAAFDTTPTFDTKVVSEYLDSTTKNPLVTAANITLASDQRIFSSDNNATMNLLNSAGTFSNTCAALLARMIDTVPSNVHLSEEVSIIPAKVYAAQITILVGSDSQRQLTFTTTLRLTQNNTTIPPNRQVKMLWCDRLGEFKDCNKITNVAISSPALSASTQLSPLSRSMKVTFQTYTFQVPLSANRSVSKFWFEVDEGDGSSVTTHDNGGEGYPVVQDALIYIPSLSSVTFPGNLQKSQNLVVGIRSDLEANLSSASIRASDFSGLAQIPALNATIPLVKNTTDGGLTDGYSYYSAMVNTSSIPTFDFEAVISGGAIYAVDYQPPVDDSPPQSSQMSVVTNITTPASTTSSSAPKTGKQNAANGFGVNFEFVGISATLIIANLLWSPSL